MKQVIFVGYFKMSRLGLNFWLWSCITKQQQGIAILGAFCALWNHFLQIVFIPSSQLLPSLHIFWITIFNETAADGKILKGENIEAILFQHFSPGCKILCWYLDLKVSNKFIFFCFARYSQRYSCFPRIYLLTFLLLFLHFFRFVLDSGNLAFDVS